MAGIELTVTFVDPWTPKDQQTIANHGGLRDSFGSEDFWFAGQGITVTFKGADGDPAHVGIDVAEEGAFDQMARGCPAAGSTAIRRTRGGISACPRETADSEGAVVLV